MQLSTCINQLIKIYFVVYVKALGVFLSSDTTGENVSDNSSRRLEFTKDLTEILPIFELCTKYDLMIYVQQLLKLIDLFDMLRH